MAPYSIHRDTHTVGWMISHWVIEYTLLKSLSICIWMKMTVVGQWFNCYRCCEPKSHDSQVLYLCVQSTEYKITHHFVCIARFIWLCYTTRWIFDALTNINNEFNYHMHSNTDRWHTVASTSLWNGKKQRKRESRQIKKRHRDLGNIWNAIA